VLIYNPPGTTHRDRFTGDGGLFMSISVPASVLDAFDRASSLPAHAMQFEDAPLSLALRLANEYDHCGEEPALVLDSLCAELLHATADIEDAAEGQRPAWLRIVREWLHDECGRDLRLGQLAAAADVHPVYLARAFRKTFHCTPGDYLRRCRLTRAAALLADANRPLAEIADESGFFDQAHFTRRFKHAYGISPGRYREATAPRRFSAYKTA
jgi:AraC family transcriptional regulator